MSILKEFTNIPYDNDEDYFFNSINKSSYQSTLPTVVQIFERIRVLISNSGVSSVTIGNFIDKNSSTTGTTGLMPAQLVNNLKTDAQSPFSIILKHVILSGIDGFKSGTNELMSYLRTAISSGQPNGLLLRFSSHLALLYRSSSFDLKDDNLIGIVDSYSQYLIENQYRQIIAYYLSQLPSEIQIKRYASFLQSITDNKERQVLLKLAKERNMNVQAITQNIVDILSKKSNNKSGETPNETVNETGLSTTMFIGKSTDLFTAKTGQTLNDDDRTRINAIDWIIYDSVQRFKLLEYANLTMRYFLLERQNLEATKMIYSKIPQDALNIVLNQYSMNTTGTSIHSNLQQVIDNLPINVTNTIKEYLCFTDYIEAVNSYNDWFDFFHKEKPTKPLPKFDIDQAILNQQQSGLDQSNVFAERIAYDYQLKQYEDLLQRWSSKAKIFCDKTRSKFQSLLKFQFGGWMVDVTSSDEDSDYIINNRDDMNIDDEDSMMTDGKSDSQIRKSQLEALRKLYLPNICFVLSDMLAKMNMNKELINMSQLIAAEDKKLYTLFDTKQLRIFINKVGSASSCLLDEGGDFFGYN